MEALRHANRYIHLSALARALGLPVTDRTLRLALADLVADGQVEREDDHLRGWTLYRLARPEQPQEATRPRAKAEAAVAPSPPAADRPSPTSPDKALPDPEEGELDLLDR